MKTYKQKYQTRIAELNQEAKQEAKDIKLLASLKGLWIKRNYKRIIQLSRKRIALFTRTQYGRTGLYPNNDVENRIMMYYDNANIRN